MTASIYGDSISTFRDMNPEGHIVYYNTDNCMRHGLADVSDTWWGKVLSEFRWELLVNASYSGSRVSGDSFPSGCSPQRMKYLKSAQMPDIILVYLGYNDFGFSVPMTSDKTDDEMSFKGAYRLMLRRLKDSFPDSKIICGTIMQNYIFYRPDLSEKLNKNSAGTSLEAYNEIIREVCSSEKVLLADLHGTGICCDTLSDMHCTKRGHREMAEAWISQLKKLV